MKTNKTTTTELLKSIDDQLKAILENDIKKLHEVKDVRVKQAAFLQLIAA